MWTPKTKTIKPVWLPFHMPHEWLLSYLHQAGAKEEAMLEKGTYKSQKLAEMCDAWGEPVNGMVPVGLHGDGVPVQGRMNQSTVDFWTLNPPCSATFQAQRVPICCLESKYIAGAQSAKSLLGACKSWGKLGFPLAGMMASLFISGATVGDCKCLAAPCLQRLR